MQLASEQSAQLEKSLAGRLSGELYVDPHQRSLYSTDASIYQIQPAAVVVPKTLDDVVCVHQAAAEIGLPIIPRGGGTSLSGQSIGAGVILDFSKYLSQILEIDPAQQTARVQPGVVLDVLNAAAAKHGLQFAPDVATSSRANIGGMIGNNSAGARSIWHGKTVDHVVELNAVSAAGERVTFGPQNPAELAAAPSGPYATAVREIVQRHRDEIAARYPRILRRVSGYNLDEFVSDCRDRISAPRYVKEVRARESQRYGSAPFNLAKLIVGAEGTLATITEARLHLIPLPKFRGVVALHFSSMASAVAATLPALELDPSAVELFDGLIVRLARASLEYRHYMDFVAGSPESMLLVEFSGPSLDEVERQARLLEQRLNGHPGLEHVLHAIDPDRYAHVWACRKAALPLLLGVTTPRKPVAFVEDAAVAPEHLGAFVEQFCDIMKRHDTDGAFYGHASVGCLHIRPMLDLTHRDDLQRLQAISQEVCDLVLRFGGAMSGEHGDGLARSYLNERLFGPRLYQAFKQVKAAFDPRGLMNPGKVVDGPNPTDQLRYGASYQRLHVVTELNFAPEGGFAHAAEMCNGAGVCRKTQAGTMCPSFMATGDEEHSTRGRANALRLALSGVLPAEELTSKKMYETFDLCLLCKGCKAECPSNVDVAKLKMEFLHHYHQVHEPSAGDKLSAHAWRANRLGSSVAPLINAVARSWPGRWLVEQLFGFDRRRPLPTFERNHFRRWYARREPNTSSARRGTVVLLDDCLTSYCEPRVNRAAVEVLEAAGFDVHLAGLECCGRTLVSKGFLKEAKHLAAVNVAKLHDWAVAGASIVGCEPSCLLMLKDDYHDLFPTAQTESVAAAARLIDDFLLEQGMVAPAIGGQQTALLHGHCHQKALCGMQDSTEFLRELGYAPQLIDSGCCGMAGSFGYEHYDVSMKIGERVLFPAVRAQAEATVVAAGFSCRQQILHGTGRRALHPVELLAERLTQPR